MGVTPVVLSRKAALDQLFNGELARLAHVNGHELTARMASEFALASNRSQDWVSALSQYAIESDPSHAALLAEWIGKWSPLVDRAIAGLAHLFADAKSPFDPGEVEGAVADARAFLIGRCGLA